MEFLVSKLKSRMMGIVLACTLCVPTLTLGMEHIQPEQKTYGSQNRSTITTMCSSLLVPYALQKMGYNSQKSYPALVSQSFLTPSLSYLAWEGWTWLNKKLSRPEALPLDRAHSKQEKIETRKDLRKAIMIGGISNCIAAAIIKKTLGAIRENPETGFSKKAVLWGLELGVQYATSALVGTVWNWLFTKKATPVISIDITKNQQPVSAQPAVQKTYNPHANKAKNQTIHRY